MCIRVLSSSLAEVGERPSGVDMVADVGRRFGRHVKVKNNWIACEIAHQLWQTNQLLFIWQMNPHVLSQVVTSAERLITSLIGAGVRFLTIEYNDSEKKEEKHTFIMCMNTPNMSLQLFFAHETLATTRNLADKYPFPLLSLSDPFWWAAGILVTLWCYFLCNIRYLPTTSGCLQIPWRPKGSWQRHFKHRTLSRI